MKIRTSLILASILNLISAPVAFGELKLPAPSPASSVSQQIGVTEVAVHYSSPGVKGRKIWGEIVPYDKVWRTGANQCTQFITNDNIEVAGKNLLAGKYCLFTIPSKDSWELIFNKDERPFAAVDYEKTQDVLRVSIKPEASSFRERMTFIFSDVTDDSAKLRIEWDTLALVIPITTKTSELALQKIKSLKNATAAEYLSAARYLKDKENKLEMALEYVEMSIDKEKGWFNTYVKGDILAAKGDYKGAAANAKAALELKDDGVLYSVFKSRIEKSALEWDAKALLMVRGTPHNT